MPSPDNLARHSRLTTGLLKGVRQLSTRSSRTAHSDPNLADAGPVASTAPFRNLCGRRQQGPVPDTFYLRSARRRPEPLSVAPTRSPELVPGRPRQNLTEHGLAPQPVSLHADWGGPLGDKAMPQKAVEARRRCRSRNPLRIAACGALRARPAIVRAIGEVSVAIQTTTYTWGRVSAKLHGVASPLRSARAACFEIGGAGSAFAIPAMLHQNMCAKRFSTKVLAFSVFKDLA